MKLKLLDLFSGIGGFSLGLESTGYFETIAFVEKDKFCQQVLKKNFKNIPIESEVRDVKGENYKNTDVITAGFPCQPFSYAGKRKGRMDDRYLWDETIRVVREVKPRWFIGENVFGIISIEKGMVLRQVQSDLEKENYKVQCFVIPAASVNAWHNRKRVWIIANSEHNGLHCEKRNETIQSSNEPKEWIFIRDNWKKNKSEFLRINDGLSSRVDRYRKERIKALGNSIVPLIARQLGLTIIKAEQDG